MTPENKAARYDRIYEQMKGLLEKPGNGLSKMATIVAVLHNKFDYFFWTGFYLLDQGELVVGPYQGPVACQQLARNTGACWTGINSGEIIIVENVHEFPGHIACNSRSNSEIVVPLRCAEGQIIGVLDVDSTKLAAFDAIDSRGLEKILSLMQHESVSCRNH
ncbi:MAG: GAF domain-containing protein [Bacteroidales bacterium]|nr:GAF domain-containing protein [Bacteroidales bacterium]MDZ4205379.1 GAF domain-containing protein [Bacteroidales bacterium]